MKKFIEEYERETLIILITLIGITRWWIPGVVGFEKLYAASHWALSYDFGLIRRGLVGALIKIWAPIVTIRDIHNTAFVVYCSFLLGLLTVFYFLLRYKENNGSLFKVILLFIAAPATLSMLARDLGRFDLFLTFIAFLVMKLLALKRFFWLIPLLMTVAMFIHESFMILYAPTIIVTIGFIYLQDNRERKVLITLFVSIVLVAGAFLVLTMFGNPAVGYEEFIRRIQARADFNITELSMRECYYSIKDHYHLAASSLYDAGSIANLVVALLILSPVGLVLLNLWYHAISNVARHKLAAKVFSLATLSGLILVPIATDYGRWLSAIIFCNFFALFFFVYRCDLQIQKIMDDRGGSSKLLFVSIIILYLMFGPLNDWNPYPYKDNLIFSAVSIIMVLFFDIEYYKQNRLRKNVSE